MNNQNKAIETLKVSLTVNDKFKLISRKPVKITGNSQLSHPTIRHNHFQAPNQKSNQKRKEQPSNLPMGLQFTTKNQSKMQHKPNLRPLQNLSNWLF